eukprot:4042515-Alexandrium_andersonii.AAC.1
MQSSRFARAPNGPRVWPQGWAQSSRREAPEPARSSIALPAVLLTRARETPQLARATSGSGRVDEA